MKMNKITMLSIVTAALLLTGCGDKSKDAVEEAGKSISKTTDKAVAATKEAASKTADVVKETADKAGDSIVKTTDKAVAATKEAASSVSDTVKEGTATATAAVASATASVADKAESDAGPAVYVKCAACHGADGKTKALGKSVVIAGQSKAELVTKINGYKAGTVNVAGMGTLMKGQVASLSEADIDAVAEYISTLK
jgi:cytochrome c553